MKCINTPTQETAGKPDSTAVALISIYNTSQSGKKQKTNAYIQMATVACLKGKLTIRFISKCSQNKPTSNKIYFYEMTAHKDLRSCVT